MHNDQMVATALHTLLRDCVDQDLVFTDPAVRSAPLWNLGITSAGFMRLLALVEDTFGIEWDLDDAPDSVMSLDGLTAFVTEHATRFPAEVPTTGAPR